MLFCRGSGGVAQKALCTKLAGGSSPSLRPPRLSCRQYCSTAVGSNPTAARF